MKEVKKEIKAEESDDGYAGANTTASSCDYSMSQFKDDPLGDLPPEEESEEDTPLVMTKILGPLGPKTLIIYAFINRLDSCPGGAHGSETTNTK